MRKNRSQRRVPALSLLLAVVVGAEAAACGGIPEEEAAAVEPRRAPSSTSGEPAVLPRTSTSGSPFQTLLRLEQRLGQTIERPEETRERRFARRVGRLGEPQTLLLGLGALYLAGNRTERRAVRDTVLVAAQVSLTSRLTKMLFGRSRPRQGQGGFRGPSLRADSFPSGHTALAFGVAAAYSRHRPGASEVAHGLAALVGWSRVAEGAHWPGDVAAGAALGLTLGAR